LFFTWLLGDHFVKLVIAICQVAERGQQITTILSVSYFAFNSGKSNRDLLIVQFGFTTSTGVRTMEDWKYGSFPVVSIVIVIVVIVTVISG
jgi:hypothetical protein